MTLPQKEKKQNRDRERQRETETESQMVLTAGFKLHGREKLEKVNKQMG